MSHFSVILCQVNLCYTEFSIKFHSFEIQIFWQPRNLNLAPTQSLHYLLCSVCLEHIYWMQPEVRKHKFPLNSTNSVLWNSTLIGKLRLCNHHHTPRPREKNKQGGNFKVCDVWTRVMVFCAFVDRWDHMSVAPVG